MKRYYMNTFGKRFPVAFTHGQGCTLYDTLGREYTDFFSGIAVNCLGYAHSAFTRAMCEQMGKYIHISNLYYVEQQALLAQRLCENSCFDKVFFANSGAEANEGAIKLARKYFYEKGEEKYRNYFGRQFLPWPHAGHPFGNRPGKISKTLSPPCALLLPCALWRYRGHGSGDK